MSSKINHHLLEEKLNTLQQNRKWSPQVVSTLNQLIRKGDDFTLYKINPLEFSKEQNLPEKETIDLFLHASQLGLFEFVWELYCPGCGDTVESFNSISLLDNHYYCSWCQLGTTASFDDYIGVTFTILPQIRQISFHNPATLPIEDFYFKYHFNSSARNVDNLRLIDIFAQNFIQDLFYLYPHEKKIIALDTEAGYLGGPDLLNHRNFGFKVTAELAPEVQNVNLIFDGDMFQPSTKVLKTGKVKLTIENRSEIKAAAALFAIPADFRYSQSHFGPFLNGKDLLNNQTFRDLFRHDVIQATEGIGIKDITVLFTDLKGSTALYEKIGDLKAFSLVREHFDHLSRVVDEYSGAIVKTIGDAVMASFSNPIDGVKAGLDMLHEIQQFNKNQTTGDLILKVGIHRGTSIAVTLNERLDYFGQTINIAARIQGLADSEEIYLTDVVYEIPEVQDLLKSFTVTPEKAKLKGVEQALQVYQVKVKS